ncbi:hypothetical protein L1987_47586 [Smallanthus sonchifolius]|uniref:Uncharacterized protein n=1 Tax=Smallanthus sonchifolius TaxID=185202 RepID=A0ACB9G2Z9_9ASTR|nr:hypothetical protein L1987_47586 [Smallanthus sonchifolius]
MASTACFMIVSRNDIPIYEAEVGTAPKKEEAAHQHQFILHAALDVVQDLAWTTSAMIPFEYTLSFGVHTVSLTANSNGMDPMMVHLLLLESKDSKVGSYEVASPLAASDIPPATYNWNPLGRLGVGTTLYDSHRRISPRFSQWGKVAELTSEWVTNRHTKSRKDTEGSQNLLRIALQMLLVMAVNIIILASNNVRTLSPHDDPLLKKCVDTLDSLARSTVKLAQSAIRGSS